jgi:hypothetical protein
MEVVGAQAPPPLTTNKLTNREEREWKSEEKNERKKIGRRWVGSRGSSIY